MAVDSAIFYIVSKLLVQSLHQQTAYLPFL
jgi:hypothetical protein